MLLIMLLLPVLDGGEVASVGHPVPLLPMPLLLLFIAMMCTVQCSSCAPSSPSGCEKKQGKQEQTERREEGGGAQDCFDDAGLYSLCSHCFVQ